MPGLTPILVRWPAPHRARAPKGDGTAREAPPEMAPGLETGTWRSDIAVDAAPEQVLDLLTDVESCDLWSPVSFRVDCLESRRLRAGSTTKVSGNLAGRRVQFRVEILEADSERLVLRAVGPVE